MRCASQEELLDYCGVGGRRACLSQSGLAGLLCGVGDCGAVVEEETVLGGKCVEQLQDLR